GAIEQHVIERITAGARRFDGDQDVLFNAGLADEVPHAGRADASIKPRVFVEGASGNDAFGRVGHFSGRDNRIIACSRPKPRPSWPNGLTVAAWREAAPRNFA